MVVDHAGVDAGREVEVEGTQDFGLGRGTASIPYIIIYKICLFRN